MRFVVTGAKGMLGGRVLDELVRTDDAVGVDIDELDVTDPASVTSFCREIEPNVIIHCAAFTDVDGSEQDPKRVFEVNALGTRNICVAAAERKAAVCYVSTDYVFDGEKRSPYNEYDDPNPLNVYGESKLAGEWYVRHLLNEFFVVRSSGLYGPGGKNFVNTILQKAQAGESLSVVDDQTSAPTYTVDLAQAIGKIVHSNLWGIYHVCNGGSCTWYDFAREVVTIGSSHEAVVSPTTSEAYGAAARRPGYSVLDNSVFNSSFLSPLRGWKEALADFITSRERSRE
jgi:dTDP-4-dehydrorhamnose reductase